jgi:hypothetical protein
MKELLSILSVIVATIFYLTYAIKARKNETKPNLVVLSLWFLFAIGNAGTYLLIEKDYFKAALLIVTALGNGCMFWVIVQSKRFLLLKRDILITIVSMAVSTAILFGVFALIGANNMHLIIQVLVTLPFIPLIMGIVQEKGEEPFMPWVWYEISIALALSAVLVQYSDLWSLINYGRALVCNLILLIIIYVYKKRTSD